MGVFLQLDKVGDKEHLSIQDITSINPLCQIKTTSHLRTNLTFIAKLWGASVKEIKGNLAQGALEKCL